MSSHKRKLSETLGSQVHYGENCANSTSADLSDFASKEVMRYLKNSYDKRIAEETSSAQLLSPINLKQYRVDVDETFLLVQ